ncbi:MAG: hypothetical protein QM767_21915 [Anaeromyxobacter sp.]
MAWIVRSLALTLLLLLPAAALAAQETPAPPAEPAPASPPPQPAPAAPPAPAASDADDFEPDRPARSIALGPVPDGHVNLTLEGGWLRSGIRADIGLLASFDLVLRADAMLLYDQLDGQTGLHGGLRVTPFDDGAVRLSLEVFYGQIFVPTAHASTNVDELGGELVAGTVLDWATFYGRVQIRGLHSRVESARLSLRESEVGFGAERALGKVLVGAEGFIWGRPDHTGMGGWRLRVAYAF